MASAEPSPRVPPRPRDADAPGSERGAGPRLPALPGLTLFECSLPSTPLEALEEAQGLRGAAWCRLAFDRQPEISELAVLQTCHRLEIYCWTRDADPFLALLASDRGRGIRWQLRGGAEAVQHLFRVTAGLESMAVGEREVRDQVRLASGRVLSRAPRPVLRPLLQRAVRTAEESVPSSSARRSIAALAASRVLEEVAHPFPRVLVVGSGVVGRTVAEELGPFARLTLVYRTRPPEPEFLRARSARAVAWETLADELADADVVVTAAKTGGRIIGPAQLAERRRPLLLVDLGLPRNVDPALRDRPGLRVIDLEGLRPARPPPSESEGVERLAGGARQAAEELESAAFESWIDAYRRESERLRSEVVAESETTLADLSGTGREAVERLTRRLVTRLLDGPTEGLRAIPSGPEGAERRRWAIELLRAEPAGS